MEIPSIIHYCWFGGNEKPDIVKKCIQSWQKFMPDFEIMEWNESNYDCHKIPYTEEAYRCKKWAFVSDYARFDILNQYGGIYFDTDVELLKPIPENILCNTAFTGMEPSGKVSPGLVFAACPGDEFVRTMVKNYENMHFLVNGVPNCKTVNSITSEILLEWGFREVNEFQQVHSLSIYPSGYFCSFDLDVHEYAIGPDSISVHHYAGTWVNNRLKWRLQEWLKRIIGVEGYRYLLNIKRKWK